jgi:uncharacterized NAD(P)/FAD-binding protein YdhS
VKLPIDHVAIIGGGFSGALQAINLLRHEGPRATLIERSPVAGRGVAYSTAHPDHLLNVRAGNMSALPQDPNHFVRWLERRRPELSGFVPRLVYGDYLAELLAEAQAAQPDRLTILNDEAYDVALSGEGAAISLASGTTLAADAVILAPGNLPPLIPRPLDPEALPPGVFAPEPWSADVAEGLTDDDTVLIVGAGLTMVDIVLLLEARGFKGKMVALSRRGLAPRAHADAAVPTTLDVRPPPHAVALVRHVRARSQAVGWRAAVDELRPYTESLWRAASEIEHRRFLRHLRAWWDVHRHRIAPQVAAKIEALRQEGRLEIVGGKLEGAEANGAGARVRYRPRGSSESVALDVRRIVNATGPQGDVLRSDQPLIRHLRERGMIRPDRLRIGIDVTTQSEVIDAQGRVQERLLALGPMTRGTFWEIVAVPDIRRQTWSVARKLSNAHWVGGEGL